MKENGERCARPQDASTANAPKGSKTITSYFISVALVAVLLLLGSVALTAAFGQRARQALWQVTANQAAELISRDLTVQVAALYQGLAETARLDVLQKALQNGDQSVLTELVQVLQSALPPATRLLIVPKGDLSPDPNANPPIGYALLDMVKVASAGRRPPAEIHLPGRPGASVNLVEPIRASDTILGVLVLTLPADRWFRYLTPPPQAWVGLRRQHSDDDSVILAESGNRQAAGPRIRLAVPGTAWQLEYIGGHSAAPLAGINMPLAFAVIAAGILLILLTAVIASLRLRRVLAADGQTFVRIVRDRLNGEWRTHYPMRLRELQAVSTAVFTTQTPVAGTEPSEEKVEPAADSEWVAVPRFMEVAESNGAPPGLESVPLIDPSILRAYDIRGIIGKTLTPEVVHWLGRAIGSEAAVRNQQTIVVGYDGRHSSPELAAALREGLMAAGRHVIDIGRVPTPVVYFATHYLDSHAGVVVTGSHNPSDYNGVKIVLGGESLSGGAIQALGRRIESGDLHRGSGEVERQDILAAYRERVLQDIALHRPLKVVVDCGNGVCGELVPDLMRALGCEIVELFCEVDGDFPNHHPDPTVPENLELLIQQVRAQQADLGLAFDGDGDRLGVVDNYGKIIWPDRQLMLFAEDILSRNPGSDIVFDVKCTSRLADVITEAAGVPVLWKTGHSLIKNKLRETGALLGGEMSGHIVFNDRWYGFDDGIYAAARLLEILSMDPRVSAEVFAQLPEAVSTPELRLDLEEGESQRLMAALLEQAAFGDARVTTIDGLRVDFPDGWGLVRASNTQPCLVLRFEGDDAIALERIETTFRALIERVRPDLKLPF